MKQTNIDREIRTRIETFLNELSTLVKSAAVDAVRQVLGDAGAPAAVPAAPAAAPAPKARRSRGRGGKRSSEQVSADTAAVLDYIKANPGQRLEQIGAGMNRPTKGLKLPIQKLIAEKAISTTGQRRGTKYTAGGGSAKRRGRAKKA